MKQPAAKRKQGASTIIVLISLVAVGVAGLGLVSGYTSELAEGLPANKAEAQTLRYAPPEGCRGARVIQTLPPHGAARAMLNKSALHYGSFNDRSNVTPMPAIFEAAHNADFDNDGDTTSVIRSLAVNSRGNNMSLVHQDGTIRLNFLFDDSFIVYRSDWPHYLEVSSNFADHTSDYIRAAESELQIATHQGRGCWTAYWCHPNSERGYRDPSCTTTESQAASYVLPPWCEGARRSAVSTIPVRTANGRTPNDWTTGGDEVAYHAVLADGLSEAELGADFDGDGATSSNITHLVGVDIDKAISNRSANITPRTMWVVFPHDAPGSWDDSFGDQWDRYVERAVESEVRIAVDRDAGCWTVFWCHPDGAVGYRDPICGTSPSQLITQRHSDRMAEAAGLPAAVYSDDCAVSAAFGIPVTTVNNRWGDHIWMPFLEEGLWNIDLNGDGMASSSVGQFFFDVGSDNESEIRWISETRASGVWIVRHPTLGCWKPVRISSAYPTISQQISWEPGAGDSDTLEASLRHRMSFLPADAPDALYRADCPVSATEIILIARIYSSTPTTFIIFSYSLRESIIATDVNRDGDTDDIFGGETLRPVGDTSFDYIAQNRTWIARHPTQGCWKAVVVDADGNLVP